MRKNSIKNTRINGEVQKELSSIIRGEIKDPRIHPMTSVMAVEVAPDLKTCKAYISVLGNQCGRIYPPSACQKPEPSKYTGDSFYSGRINRIWCKYVKIN